MPKHDASPSNAHVPPLTNVHEALQRAVISDRDKVTLANANFKCHPIKKEIAEDICLRSGTTLSSFLRECVNGLVADYVGPKKAAQLEHSV